MVSSTTAPTGDIPAAKPEPRLRESKPPVGERVRDLAWLCAMIFRAAPRHAIVWAAAALLTGVLAPLQIWAGGQVIGSIIAGSEGRVAQSPWLWLAMIAIAQVGSRFLDVATSYAEAVVAERGGPAIQARVYAQATSIELSDFEHQGFYDLTSRITTEIETQAASIGREIMSTLVSAPRLIGALVLIFNIDWRIGLIALLPMIPNMIMYFRSGDRMWTMLSDQTRDRRLATYYAERITDRQTAKEIRLFQLQGHLLGRWSHHYLATRDELRRKRFWLAMRTFSISATTLAAALAGLIWLIFGADLELSPPEITILMSSFLTLPNWVFDFAGQAIVLGQSSGLASDTRAFMERKAPFASDTTTPNRSDPASPQSPLPDFIPAIVIPRECSDEGPPGPSGPVSLAGTASAVRLPRAHVLAPELAPAHGGSLETRDLRFTYPGSARKIIDGVSLVIPAGQRVAIVGENGAGKTTLIKLLLGLYDAEAGTVTLDGTPLRNIPLVQRQRRLSAVFQQFTKYPLTLEENIRLRGATGSDSAKTLDDVLAMAGMDTYVQDQPDGVTTMLSPDIGGVDLSGGQWQRLAIARAGFRDADVLALDEPTAALDPMAEVDIFRRFARLAAGRTTLLVSHRLGMARLADRIIVIENGRIIEDGSHEQLRTGNGRYARMWEMQARWYV